MSSKNFNCEISIVSNILAEIMFLGSLANIASQKNEYHKNVNNGHVFYSTRDEYYGMYTQCKYDHWDI